MTSGADPAKLRRSVYPIDYLITTHLSSTPSTMFTVKATYRSEIRKFTFPNPSFPTFSQINDQVTSSSHSLFFIVLTDFSSFAASCLSAHPIISLVSFLSSLKALLLLAYSLVWRPIQKKNTNNTFVLSVAASGQVVSFVSPYTTKNHPARFHPTSLLNRMTKTS